MFVLNDCRTDARVLREAATLAGLGYQVTVVARTSDPYAAAGERERRDGFEILRVPVAAGLARWVLLGRRPSGFVRQLGRFAARSATRGPRGWATLVGAIVALVAAVPVALLALIVAVVPLAVLRSLPAGRPVWLALEWRLQWQFGVRPWTRGAVLAAPPAEIYHAHDLRALPAALAARSRAGGAVVYDSHEIFVEAGANAGRPASSRAALRRLERTLAAGADAFVTVNDELAAVLGAALGLSDRTVVVRNCPPRWDPPVPAPDLLRTSAGIPKGARVILCHGAFVAGRGFDEVAAALALPVLAGVHAVFLGYGPLWDHLVRVAANPSIDGRLHVLAAVPPLDLPKWIAGADVDVVAIQPTTQNHRLSTPNKLFESLAAGVPVVASDFGPMRRIVIDDPDGPLGAVCDPTDPAAIAAAVRTLLDLPAEAVTDLRRRCLTASHARYAWEVDGARLAQLYARLAGSAGHVAAARGPAAPPAGTAAPPAGSAAPPAGSAAPPTGSTTPAAGDPSGEAAG